MKIEYAVPAWNSGIGNGESDQVERVQKSALAVIYRNRSYTNNLEKSKLQTLKNRREDISKKFAIKTAQNPKFAHWFVKKSNPKNTRQLNKKYKDPVFRCDRFRRSPIPYLTSLLNSS